MYNIKQAIEGMLTGYCAMPDFLDEVFGPGGKVNPQYKDIIDQFSKLSAHDFNVLNERARQSFLKQGITYSVYNDKEKGQERIFPFDLIPRLIDAREWQQIEKGVIQRSLAINSFLYDIYHKQEIINDGIVPRELVTTSKHYIKQMANLDPAGGIYNHISGTDLVRHSDGQYYVLEDNVRTPSGISYVLANRTAMKRSLAQIFSDVEVRPVHDYVDQLLAIMRSVAPEGTGDPSCAVLTDGVASAYFEHSSLALNMGMSLVEGKDLYVKNDVVYMKTMRGPKRIDVLYRRVEDEFMDPLVFEPDSVWGIPGIMSAYKAKNITLINAPGTGAADDKSVYSFVPDFIKYYLNEEPVLNNVHTYKCTEDDAYHYVLENMDKLVIKPVDEFGGHGILIGNTATDEQIEEQKKLIQANRRKYVAQPIISLSTHPTYIDANKSVEPRHVDLRVYTLLGKNKQFVLKGGLSRVALKEGNMIVNSSQGGGSKDTWVLASAKVMTKPETKAEIKEQMQDRKPQENKYGALPAMKRKRQQKH
jgi:uncharacterized circularly permuted ATP-grasp superfamily protein